MPVEKGHDATRDASAGGDLHVTLARVQDEGAVRDQSGGLLDEFCWEEAVAVATYENDRHLDMRQRWPRVERHLRLDLHQKVAGRVVLPGAQGAADPGPTRRRTHLLAWLEPRRDAPMLADLFDGLD